MASLIIAADRGAKYCLDAGITPQLVVGDMDSLDDESAERLAGLGVELKHFSPDKDRTDTEIALEEAISRGARRLEIIGAIGNRLDHTLANIHLLFTALRRGVVARMVSDTQQVFLVNKKEIIKDNWGRTISFLPLTERVEGITLNGFFYELDCASMEIGKPYGISNVVKSDSAQVTVAEGVLIAVLNTA